MFDYVHQENTTYYFSTCLFYFFHRTIQYFCGTRQATKLVSEIKLFFTTHSGESLGSVPKTIKSQAGLCLKLKII